MRTQQTGFECKLPSKDVGGFFVVVVKKENLQSLMKYTLFPCIHLHDNACNSNTWESAQEGRKAKFFAWYL